MMRVAFLGPAGTFSAQAVAAADLPGAELLPQATIHAVVLAVQEGAADRGVVPVENSIEGAVNETLDALVHDAPDVEIVADAVLAVSYCLIARAGVAQAEITDVISHPQALGQCARFVRAQLPGAAVRAATSTAEAVRIVSASTERWGALGTRHAAELYGGSVLAENVQDEDGNATRFLWIAAAGSGAAWPGGDRSAGAGPGAAASAAWKSSVVFSGDGDGTPGWLVRCLSEFASRDVNLSRIESRPSRHRLGHYLFLVDLAGRADVPGPVADAVAALEGHCAEVRLLGSYPAAG